MVDRYNPSPSVDRREGRPTEPGRAILEGRSSTRPTRREALVARTMQALRAASNPRGGATSRKAR
jgi:hypothetical protein